MVALDRFRAAANYGRRAVDTLGLRVTSVTVVVETYDAAVGMDGATRQSRVATVLTPTPRVRVVGLTSSAFGGGRVSGDGDGMQAPVVEIDRITPPYPGGGYAATDLDPATSDPKQLTYLVLAGGAFDAAGERFTVTKVDQAAGLQTVVTAERTAQS